MCIKNRYFSLVYRIIFLVFCFIGLLMNTGIFEGSFNLFLFIFYTILSNLLCFVFFIFLLIRNISDIRKKGAKGISVITPRFKGAVTLTITITFLIYNFVLVPQMFAMKSEYEVFSFRDVLVHYVVPIMTIFDWILFDNKNTYKWYDPLIWVFIPLIYYVFTIIRAALGGTISVLNSRYPYFFIDSDALGWGKVMIYVVVMLFGFLFLGYVFYILDKITLSNGKIHFCLKDKTKES